MTTSEPGAFAEAGGVSPPSHLLPEAGFIPASAREALGQGQQFCFCLGSRRPAHDCGGSSERLLVGPETRPESGSLSADLPAAKLTPAFFLWMDSHPLASGSGKG